MDTIDFQNIQKQAENFAEHLIQNRELIHSILNKYQSFDLIDDEIRKCTETLRNMSDLKPYYSGQVDLITCFLPLNLPLYSLLLFAVMPSYQAKKVVVRAPSVFRELFDELYKKLSMEKFIGNVHFFDGTRKDFIDTYCKKSQVIIFTGKYENFDKIRDVCSKDTLMLFNGSGHNPAVVTEVADIKLAVKKIITSKLYNNGQDCIAPNMIFTHAKISDVFQNTLLEELSKLKVGQDYSDKETKIGPLMDRDSILHFIHLTNSFIDKGAEIIYGGQIDLKHNLAYPIVFKSSINKFINYQELYSPIFVVDTYDNDQELRNYFKDKDGHYLAKQMYVSVFGHSDFVEKDLKNSIILMNETADEIESGNKEFGGYSLQSSVISYKGDSIARPILIPREISEFLFKK